ncbi:MAG: orotate phosphoribosyltransferase [Azospirillum sp.]|nr:orotate phosphoribosyltransferase [Azospirillum sp.]
MTTTAESSQAVFDPRSIAALTAALLLEVKAVHFNAETPYIFTSGRASPVYVDIRRLISFPRARRAVIDFAVALLVQEVGFEAFDSVAGGETAGIPYAAWLAERLGLPMQYVRKKPKGFGRDAQIEGVMPEGSRVLLVEDLATDGGSKLNFIDAIRKAGATVSDVFVVFHYGIFPESRTSLAEVGVRLHGLTTWWDVLAVARSRGHFDAATLSAVESFLHAPAEWSAAHGGAV